jgi:hypothetical protein
MGRLDRAGYPSYANRREIAFYRDIASDLREQVVPLCFETVDATENTTWHLLLEDLTESHFIATEWPLPPTLEQCHNIVEAQACLHGAWWDSPRLGGSVGTWRDTDAFDHALRSFAGQLASFTGRSANSCLPSVATSTTACSIMLRACWRAIIHIAI